MSARARAGVRGKGGGARGEYGIRKGLSHTLQIRQANCNFCKFCNNLQVASHSSPAQTPRTHPEFKLIAAFLRQLFDQVDRRQVAAHVDLIGRDAKQGTRPGKATLLIADHLAGGGRGRRGGGSGVVGLWRGAGRGCPAGQLSRKAVLLIASHLGKGV